MDEQRKWITVEEASAILGIKPATLRAQLRRGEPVPSRKLGRTWRISREWAEGQRDEPKP